MVCSTVDFASFSYRNARTFNPFMHNVQKWSDTLTILGHYALKGNMSRAARALAIDNTKSLTKFGNAVLLGKLKS